MKKLPAFIAFFNLFLVARHSAQSIQLMHNSCDNAVQEVKVWINDTVWMSSFNFQQATAAWNCNSGTYTVGISYTAATTQSQSIVQQAIDVQPGQNHFLVINGIPGNSANPLVVTDFSPGSVGQPSALQTSARFHNGCISFSAVTLSTGTGTLAANLVYAQNAYSGLINAAAAMLTVTGGVHNNGSFNVPFQNYAGTNVNIVINDCALPGVKTSTGLFGIVIVPPSGNTFYMPQDGLSSIQGAGANDMNISVGPNPINDMLNLSLSGISGEALSLQVTDIAGKQIVQVRHQPASTETAVALDVERLSPGIYFLNISQGSAKKTMKFIRE